MLVFVTQDHIDRGAAMSSMGCPIALAIIEQFDKAKGQVTVGPNDAFIDWSNNDHHINYKLDRRGRDFVNAFDCGRQWVKPCIVELIQRPNHLEALQEDCYTGDGEVKEGNVESNE